MLVLYPLKEVKNLVGSLRDGVPKEMFEKNFVFLP